MLLQQGTRNKLLKENMVQLALYPLSARTRLAFSNIPTSTAGYTKGQKNKIGFKDGAWFYLTCPHT